MRKPELVSIAVVTIMVLSGVVAALPAQLDIPHSPGAGGVTPLGSDVANPAQGNTPNPDVHWTTSFTNVSYKKDYTMAGWSGGKIVASGKRVEEDLKIEVHDFRKHVNLEVEVNGNEVGGNLMVHVYNNPFLLNLKVTVGGNKVGGNIAVIVSTSSVSNLNVGVSENRGCIGLMTIVANNTIDYTMNVGVRDNNVTERMVISITGNVRPAGWPQLFTLMDVNIKDNHVVKKTLQIYIMRNIMAERGALPIMKIQILSNGAGTDIWTRIIANEAYPVGLMFIDILDNACDMKMRIFVLGNKAYKIYVDVKRNYGCSGSTVKVQKNAIGPAVEEASKCLQKTAPDSDKDGLTDLYEIMIGTNATNPDTDNDGLYDGWNDTNGDRRYTSGEVYGELGDPTGHKFKGSIDNLVQPKKHRPNPLCCDIYVEVDYIKGQKKLSKNSISSLEDKFKKHRIKLHIDNGWGSNAAGGQMMKADLREYIGDKYLVWHSIAGGENDYYDFFSNPKYYDRRRNEIFHYAIVAPYLAVVENGLINYTDTTVGLADHPGDNLAIAAESLEIWINATYLKKDRKKAMDYHLAATLMHELGHNIDLSDTNVSGDKDLTTMYHKAYANAPLDYKQPSEWAAIWPDKVDEP